MRSVALDFPEEDFWNVSTSVGPKTGSSLGRTAKIIICDTAGKTDEWRNSFYLSRQNGLREEAYRFDGKDKAGKPTDGSLLGHGLSAPPGLRTFDLCPFVCQTHDAKTSLCCL